MKIKQKPLKINSNIWIIIKEITFNTLNFQTIAPTLFIYILFDMLACFNTHISFHVLPFSLMALVILLHDHSSRGSHLLSQHTKKEEDIEAKDSVCLMNFLFFSGWTISFEISQQTSSQISLTRAGFTQICTPQSNIGKGELHCHGLLRPGQACCPLRFGRLVRTWAPSSEIHIYLARVGCRYQDF